MIPAQRAGTFSSLPARFSYLPAPGSRLTVNVMPCQQKPCKFLLSFHNFTEPLAHSKWRISSSIIQQSPMTPTVVTCIRSL